MLQVEDPTGEHQQLVNTLRDFLRNISHTDIAAPVLAGTRHALRACRSLAWVVDGDLCLFASHILRSSVQIL